MIFSRSDSPVMCPCTHRKQECPFSNVETPRSPNSNVNSIEASMPEPAMSGFSASCRPPECRGVRGSCSTAPPTTLPMTFAVHSHDIAMAMDKKCFIIPPVQFTQIILSINLKQLSAKDQTMQKGNYTKPFVGP